MSYDGFSGSMSHADHTALDSGETCFLDNDIMMAAKDSGAPVHFTVTAEGPEGIVAAGGFTFDAQRERMYLTVTEDGRIVEGEGNEG